MKFQHFIRSQKRRADSGQAGTPVREVLDDAPRVRLGSNIAAHLLNGVTEPVLKRAFQYWRNIDTDLGDTVEVAVRDQQHHREPTAPCPRARW
jgi:catalase